MILKDNGDYSTESSAESEEEDEVQKPPEGELLMVRRMLGSQIKGEDTNQRENIFHTRCMIQEKVCSLIIDGGSCTNVASTRLVSKLNLETKPHPKPYKLQWLSDAVEMTVDKQVEVCFSIGKYQDIVLCDVVPMEASHMLLGRPWQFDKKATHEGHTNKFSFLHNGQKITLVPLTPGEVREDQIKMREKINQEEKEREKKEEGNNKKSKNSEKKNNVKERKENFFATKGEIKRAICSHQPIYLLCPKEFSLISNKLETDILPSGIEFLLQEFKDVFPKGVPNGLPPIRGIEHHIDLISGASFPNRPAYRSNHQQTNEALQG